MRFSGTGVGVGSGAGLVSDPVLGLVLDPASDLGGVRVGFDIIGQVPVAVTIAFRTYS